jgi:hypothetical protein
MLRGVIPAPALFTTTTSSGTGAAGVTTSGTRTTGSTAAGAPIARRLLVAALLFCGLLPAGGCSALEPQLSPRDPPPNIAPDQLLLEIPQSVVDAMATQAVVHTLDLALAGAQEKLGIISLPPGHAQRILLHQVVTGMTEQEVVWCFLSHPTRVREQGPPGGHTLLWEPPGYQQGDRYWVRFDENGVAWSAGLY